ncbi:MAG TPA: LacI family DNA-binding transcriptional regulator, partial [Anaerolineales bacterium]|nr:LacI family DNA-binding transcriptional regulator [Anaerolineales bacterium]
MGPVTIRDVAKRANVGVGTVSRVLNNSTAVREETRQRVIQAIDELDYSPNPIAQQLSSGQTNAIAVTLPFLTYPSFVERLRGVQSALTQSNYQLVLYSAETPNHRDKHFDMLSRRTRADGVLIISIPLSEQHARKFIESDTPTVLVDIFHPEMNRVFVDDLYGGYLATKHLLDLGHKKIAFISDRLETQLKYVSMKNRMKGYLDALERHDIEFNPQYHLEDFHGRAEARQMAHTILSLDDPPTAIFAGSDTQAIGVLDAARELGLRVPEDLSVIGYDNIRDAEYLNLTTIAQPLFESGFEGARLLLSILDNPTDQIHEI